MPGPRSVTTELLGTWMHHVEVGTGPAVLLLHGNPTSSFLWRHVLARAAQDDRSHRWVAPDLVGMGRSGRPASAYRLVDHVDHVEALVDALGLDEVVLVGHDWGVAVSLVLHHRARARVRGIAMMEAHLRPLPSWDAFDPDGRELFQRLRTPGVGEQMVLEEDFFLSTLLPAALQVGLTAAELDAYRAPYPDPASRLPLLRWAREIPVAGEPAGTAALFAAASEHLVASDVRTLLLTGQPGVLTTAAVSTWCRDNLRRLEVVDVGGPAGHFLPEDRPQQVADALLAWVPTL